jgi:phytanoyl-CoA hydroxylase
MLSTEQVRFFRHSGYMRLPISVDSTDVEAIHRYIIECARSNNSPDVHLEGDITYISQILKKHSLIESIFASASLLECLKCLLGDNIELLLNRHNHATLTPFGNRNVRFHRDILQWSRTVLSVILYLEEASVESGCTQIIPGSHLFPFIKKPNNGGTWMDEHEIYAGLAEQAVPVPMEKGGLLVFDGLIFHSPGPNQKQGSIRPVITMAYTSVDELLGIADIPSRLLVSGSRIYKGNVKYIKEMVSK